MSNQIEYIFRQVKEGRISRAEAVELLCRVDVSRNDDRAVHPLLQQHTFDAAEHRFTSTLNGDEFFLKDHVIQGQKVLPGVCYLEMMYAAATLVRQQNGADNAGRTMGLKDIVWLRPFVVDSSPGVLKIVLRWESDEEIACEIYGSRAGGDTGEERLHARARAVFVQDVPTTLDFDVLRSQATTHVDTNACYEAFARTGLAYGPAHRSIQEIQVGRSEDMQPFVLATVGLPSSVIESAARYALHPSLLDGALQAAIGLTLPVGNSEASNAQQAFVPFALEALTFHAPLPSVVHVYLRYSDGANPKSALRKLDLDICDAAGKRCVALKGFSARALVGTFEGDEYPETLLLTPGWKTRSAVLAAAPAPKVGRWVLLAGGRERDSLYKETDIHLRGIDSDTRTKRLPAQRPGQDVSAWIKRNARTLFRLLKEHRQESPAEPTVVQLVLPDQTAGTEGLLRALAGMLKTARLEDSRIIDQVVFIGAGENAKSLVEKLQENLTVGPAVIRYRDGERQVAVWGPSPAAPMLSNERAWKDGGTYIITGGLGGLGLVFARTIARSVSTPTLVLVGRSAPDRSGVEKIEALRALGAHVDYRVGDVGQEKIVDFLIKDIRTAHGTIDGILHAAGVIDDDLLSNKTEETVMTVLAPKIDGAICLDRATRDIALDHFILFSSTSGAFGNIGQADYATANAFLDAFAEYRNALVARGERHGHTLSIDWPLWKEGGMKVDRATQTQLARHGLQALPTSEGIEAFHRAMELSTSQVVVLHGDSVRLRAAFLDESPRNPTKPANASVTSISPDRLLEKLQSTLPTLVSALLKIAPAEIDLDAEFSEFGFDSISLTEFGNVLHQTYGVALAPTLFFEHPTLRRLATYLAKEHAASLAVKLLPNETSTVIETTAPTVPVAVRRQALAPVVRPPNDREKSAPDPIAIVGISGCFPESPDLDTFWKNLESGRDCIGEIPESRWPANVPVEIRRAGLIDEVDRFDPRFFGISPREAEGMDPQQRLLMTYVWKVIEDAGYASASLSGSRTAIFIGTASSGYGSLLAAAGTAIEGHSSTGAAPSVGPNRMSYFLNLHGPSEPIETACSSSLVAIHRACRAIERGDCEMAIAGGVNTLILPEVHISFAKAGMLSPDGRCKTFSKHANGYVRGEGVGMIFLKKLSAAERDGDHIYGIVKASSENHGGRANSLTAPNPKAQADLIKEAIAQSGIDPRSITYIEAHGTGTPLGDPIEINALKSAFREYAEERGLVLPNGYCAIGAVKTYIGHLELAAGVAGVIKVLLQLKHQTLVRNLHGEEVNPYIDLKDSPFYLLDQSRPWETLTDERGQTIPRRAGVSSFGFGGVNAHVIIEEYVGNPITRFPTSAPALFVLSAKSEEQLKVQAKNLREFLDRESVADADLPAIAYTLQIGREPMEHRVAFAAMSLAQLRSMLSSVFDDRESTPDLYRGEVRRHKEMLGALTSDSDFAETLTRWIAKGKHEKLLDLWTKGLNVDWNRLYGEVKPRRLSLPTYPFEQERYWVATAAVGRPLTENARLHPLLHRNTSTLQEQRFTSTFTGEEFFFRDHLVRGQKVLPGVAYLEMARAAMAQALDLSGTGAANIQFEKIAWVQPLVIVDVPRTVHVALDPQSDGTVAFEAFTAEAGGEVRVHAEGRLHVRPESDMPTVDIGALKTAPIERAMNAAESYAAFAATGLLYGPAFQGIESVELRREAGGDAFVFAALRLPGVIAGTKNDYLLHPSMMDAALQASLGLWLDEPGSSGAPIVPFALERLQILSALPEQGYVVVRERDRNDALRKIDLDVIDPHGRVCVRLQGFACREFRDLSNGEAVQTRLLVPAWIARTSTNDTLPRSYAGHWVIGGQEFEHEITTLQAAAPDLRCLTLRSTASDLAARYTDYAAELLRNVQAVIADIPAGDVLVQFLVKDAEESSLLRGLYALLKAASLEKKAFNAQLLALSADVDSTALADLVKREAVTGAAEVRYHAGVREVFELLETVSPVDVPASPWKDHGVYLITGGGGGLGHLFADAIAHAARSVTLVLVGRSPLDETKNSSLDILRRLGATAEYHSLDVADAAAVQALIEHINTTHGRLDGVLHAAGLLQDSLLTNKTENQLREVLAPKVSGVVNLDRSTRVFDLEYFLLFSSASALFGNVGQADYAAANAFLDAFAAYRNDLVKAGERRGHTLSVNWPLWASGGMQLDPATRERLRRQTGLVPLESDAGIQALYQALTLNTPQVAVAAAAVTRRSRSVSGGSANAPLAEKTVPAAETGALRSEIRHSLTQSISEQLKIPREDLDVDAELSEFGFDSISLTAFGNALNDKWGLALSPTVFFEHPTIERLAGYLAEEYRDTFAKAFSVSTSAVGMTSIDTAADRTAITHRHPRGRFAHALSVAANGVAIPEPIAIVGVSGCFPQSPDLDTFWENLERGRDCIGEIPESRWPANVPVEIRRAGLIDEVEWFDPRFFGISPREAESMDPQQRLLMTYVWKAIEDAGYAPASLSGSKTAIFVGTTNSGYGSLLAAAGVAVEGHTSTGGAPSVGPNRMSYLLNLRGPSEPIETACSSSLVAIHRACRAIERGDCEMAIAGGVNTLVLPEIQVSFTKAGMLSPDGHCKTFSKHANGYVRGEGVGMIFLKKLSAAERDGDHIYGVIKGSAENHGGRANSLTAPNPNAQAELIEEAIVQSGIDPRTVTYIEAHGTGTPLGDPIEIQGLKHAFRALAEKRGVELPIGYCGLGSVKTNIGHLELAAGVAGVIKVLLQLKHATLVRNLHGEEINPYIDLKGSPFYLLKESRSWEALKDERGRLLPRRAGVSSFGFGGVNAHVVIEEYIAKESAVNSTSWPPALFVFSAKSEERLADQVKNFLRAMDQGAFTDADLPAIAYTLQVGREAMEHRIAFIAGSMATAKETLRDFLRGEEKIDGFCRGEVKRNKETLGALTSDSEFEETVARWIAKKRYQKILDLWTKGLAVDWQRLYGESKPRRLSLPTYPFARERYWIDMPGRSGVVVLAGAREQLHPLLHKNTSTVSTQRFSSFFTGEEFFLRDHVIQGLKTFPGVGYLEMMRATLDYAFDDAQPDTTRLPIQLKNIVFARPCVMTDGSLSLHVSLRLLRDNDVACEIYGESIGGAQPLIYAQGQASLGAPATETPRVDLTTLARRCSQTLAAESYYESFRRLGFDYGPALRAIDHVQVGADDAGESLALAYLVLPGVADTSNRFVLHPSIMDGALQATLVLTAAMSAGELSRESADAVPVALPFGIRSLEILAPSPKNAVAFIRRCKSSTAETQTLDIDISDENGAACVRIRGFMLRFVTKTTVEKTEPKDRMSVGNIAQRTLSVPRIADLSSVESTARENDDLRAKVQGTLIRIAAKLLNVKREEMDPTAEFGEFGFDSIMLTEFGNILSKTYGVELTPAIFFEHSTFERFATYLVKEHGASFAQVLGTTDASATPAGESRSATPAAPTMKRNRLARAQVVAIRPGNETTPYSADDPIAIIGMSGCFPESPDLNTFWENLAGGKDCIREIPESRWPSNVPVEIRRAGVIDGIDQFDPRFFGISPREAEGMDPQQRLLMTYAWKVIEDAGYSPASLSGTKTAVFVGTANSGYGNLLAAAGVAIEGHSSTGAASSVGPNRMSYLLNLHGPSEPIETACSSSLVAIHRACRAIERGDCEMAIAGGVNTLILPEIHESFTKAGMLSPDGRCKTFSKHANGYVRGEGAGMLFLKKLSVAERDGDHIYAVIRASAENHGGRANSLTAPNPNAQAALIRTAIAESKIDPRTITYIEAHGTGTPLGDPIEINALKSAFREYADEGGYALPSRYCAIGSVKTNIGHLELAAGVAGVIKVLLQLKHRTLVRSLHGEEVNPYIDLEDSPFYLLNESRPWEALSDEQGQPVPRRAGVSSFGFGGVNAHVVIEEYVAKDAGNEATSPSPPLLVLSAKGEERLREYAAQLLQVFDRGDYTDGDLASIAYTLQVGREAMEHRLAFAASSIAIAKTKLRDFLKGEQDIDEFYRAESKRHKEALAVFATDEDLQDAIDTWIEKGKYRKLLDLWTKGLVIDWRRLYRERTPNRISLPTYPFARERHWVPHTDFSRASGANLKGVANHVRALHPLLHENTSDLTEQRFRSEFSGAEFFFKDHVVQGRRILPGAAHLEMARAAFEKSAGVTAHDKRIDLANIVFARPMAIDDAPLRVNIALDPTASDAVAFEIYSETNDGVSTHSQGRAVLVPTGEIETLDLAALRSRCDSRSISANECYDAFAQGGLMYGQSFRGLSCVHIGHESGGEPFVLAELGLPAAAGSGHTAYVLHPSLLDATLQASIGLIFADKDAIPAKLRIPFAIERVEIFAPIPDKAIAVVRKNRHGDQTGSVQKLDFDVANSQGHLCVRLTGFSSRVLDGSPKTAATEGTRLLMPQWTTQAPILSSNVSAEDVRWVVWCEESTTGFDDEAVLSSLRVALPFVKGACLRSNAVSPAERYTDYAAQLFILLRDILSDRKSGSSRLQVVVPADGEGALFRGLGGMLASAAQENRKFAGQVLGIESGIDLETLVDCLRREADSMAAAVRYIKGNREIPQFIELTPTDEKTVAPWKAGGVYLITGGLGGIGRVLAMAIAKGVQRATLVLTGRSAPTEAAKTFLDQLRHVGATVEYRAIDVSERSAVDTLVAEVLATHGGLNGIFHSAGVLRDNLITKKTETELREVFRPKVAGLVNLDEATKDIALDGFVLFSSMSGVFGNVGQADYSAANAFMDAYAEYRNGLVSEGKRAGHTLSIDWPLWADGGMRIDDAMRERMFRLTGLRPLESEAGILALIDAVALNVSQVVVLSGDVPRLSERVPAVLPASKPSDDNSAENETLRAKVQGALTEMIAELLKVNPQDIDPEAELSELGFDSISLVTLGNTLNQKYGLELGATVAFEYPTLDGLTRYLVRQHRSLLQAHFDVPQLSVSSGMATAATDRVPLPVANRTVRPRVRFREVPIMQSVVATPEPIAIVGANGRFAQSDNLDELWENLKTGRDCISEIPPDRWPLDAFYCADKAQAMQTLRSYSKLGGFLSNIDRFDEGLLELSAIDRQMADSKELLFLATASKLLASAGYPKERLHSVTGSRVGVFVGAMPGTVHYRGTSSASAELSQLSMSALANRVSGYFELTGPSLTVDTQSSSSITALHVACESIRRGECEMAIVGGVSLLYPEIYVAFSQFNFVSGRSDSRSFTDGDGMLLSEGAGAILLKPLSRAIEDGDSVLAVIKSTAVTHTGRGTFSAPDPNAQAALFVEAIKKSGIDPRTISYIESAANGSPIGDLIEVAGLVRAFQQYTPDAQFCALGSVKSNIGHATAASGISQLIKVVLQMQHRLLIPLIKTEPLNPNLRLEGSPFYLQRELAEWRRPIVVVNGREQEVPRRAMVNSFGAGGAYASVIIEEAPGAAT